MIGAIKAWRARRAENARTNKLLVQLYAMDFPRLDPPHESYIVRGLSDEFLHTWLARTDEGVARYALERELRRREAWEAPAGKAFWISIGALVISSGALLVSILK